MDDQQDNPSFFTIIKKGCNTNRMKVPPKFLKYLNEDFSSNAILIGSSGNKWQVTIFKEGNDMYMQNGWPQFLTDNSVVPDEFLLFTYDGEYCFRVQIFSRNGCERPYLKRTRQEDAATPSLARTKKGRPRKTSAGSSHFHESKPCKEGLPLSNKGSHPKDHFSKPKIKTEIGRSEACKLPESFTSDNPYFKHLMTKSNVENHFSLPVATEFARKYIPEAVKKIILKNWEGKYWEVTVACIGTQNKRYAQFTTGWGKFARDNKLRRGDTCIFELEDRNHLMKVHIFRCAPN